MGGSKKMRLQMSIIYSLLFFLLIKEAASNSYSMVKPDCQEKCGNMSVPYPFGIGKGCYRNKMFEVNCNDSSHLAILPHFGESEVLQISMDYVRVRGHSNLVSCSSGLSGSSYSEFGWDQLFLFGLSQSQNKLVAMGCNIFAYLTDINDYTTYITGCASVCYNTGRTIDSSCFGYGCCQTSLPNELVSFKVGATYINTEAPSRNSSPCSTSFIVENNFSEFNKYLNIFDNGTELDVLPGVPLVFDWAIGNVSCHEARARKDYACGPNSNCIESNIINDGAKYRCRCSHGYQGNPYLPDGCQDTDECKDQKKDICPIGALCKNTEGSYSCVCPPGSHSINGNGTGCIPNQGRRSLQLVMSLGIGIAIGILLLIAIGLWLYRKFEKRRKNKIKQKFFKRNGGLLLQQQISSSTESVVKTKLFIAEELEKATDKFNESRILGKGGLGTVYKGMISDGSIVAVKKSNIVDENQVGQFINEVLILSHINHRNIVKLLGCCLETEVPILVYEYVSNGTLSDHLHDEGYVPMAWINRLSVAGEIAGALAYLHSCASTAIIHRDIKSSNILLDNNYRAVVSDFGISRSVPLNKTHWTTLVGGTFGYFDPEYFRSGQLTDRSDVYAFGVVLAELLTGKKAISADGSYEEGLALHFRSSLKQNSLFEVLDTQVVNESQDEEIHVVATLAKRCLKMNAKKRPSMKEVAAELDQLRRIQELPLIRQNSLDNNDLVSERSSSYTIDAVEEES
ncbi:putative wall-associated receptor kinase-like 11 [Cornus florida]|uniref:putative wall-associated receptor kinase-like 11 n=1 Tax=Cornus florida TaxID=4283 RepID=UPI002896BB37|nr:putative wall-associated receptor kinase-like 11 [Cornus florida]